MLVKGNEPWKQILVLVCNNIYLDLVQQKTKKTFTIPVIAPHVIDNIKNDFPYKISKQKLNLYIKKDCEIAKIEIMTEGKIYGSK